MAALKNAKHEAFCREIAGGMSVNAAWVVIGNNASSNNASRLARQEHIVARIGELRAEFNQGAAIQLAYLQEKLLTLASADATRFFESAEEGGLKLRDITKLPAELRAAVSEVRIDGGKVSFKMHNKLHAIDSLIDTIGGKAPQRVELTGKEGAPLDIDIDDPHRARDLARRICLIFARAEAGG